MKRQAESGKCIDDWAVGKRERNTQGKGLVNEEAGERRQERGKGEGTGKWKCVFIARDPRERVRPHSTTPFFRRLFQRLLDAGHVSNQVNAPARSDR